MLQLNFEYQGGYRLAAAALTDAGGSHLATNLPLSDAPQAIELDWQAASAPGANDGALTVV